MSWRREGLLFILFCTPTQEANIFQTVFLSQMDFYFPNRSSYDHSDCWPCVKYTSHITFMWDFTRGRFAWFSKKQLLPAPTSSPRNYIPPTQWAGFHPPCSIHSAHFYPKRDLNLPYQLPPSWPWPCPRTVPHTLILLIFHKHLLVFHRCHYSLLTGEEFLFTSSFFFFLVNVNS